MPPGNKTYIYDIYFASILLTTKNWYDQRKTIFWKQVYFIKNGKKNNIISPCNFAKLLLIAYDP